MMTCQSFRAAFGPGSEDVELLRHLRECDACLDHAVTVDPEAFFRAIGGEELQPPGGVEAFTQDVMAQIRLRQTEGSVARRFLVAPRRLAAAAAVVVAVGTAGILYDQARRPEAPPAAPAVASAARPEPLVTKPVVETYQSEGATIVELAGEGPHEANVVMIFDESLPADL